MIRVRILFVKKGSLYLFIIRLEMPWVDIMREIAFITLQTMIFFLRKCTLELERCRLRDFLIAQYEWCYHEGKFHLRRCQNHMHH